MMDRRRKGRGGGVEVYDAETLEEAHCCGRKEGHRLYRVDHSMGIELEIKPRAISRSQEKDLTARFGREHCYLKVLQGRWRIMLHTDRTTTPCKTSETSDSHGGDSPRNCSR